MPEPSESLTVHDDESARTCEPSPTASAAVPAFGDDLEVLAVAPKRKRALANDFVIVDHQKTQGTCLDLARSLFSSSVTPTDVFATGHIHDDTRARRPGTPLDIESTTNRRGAVPHC